LGGQLNREQAFGERAYPALVHHKLNGDRIALIALGGVPSDLADDIQAAIDPTGGRLAEVSVVTMPPDTDALAARLKHTRFRRLDPSPDVWSRFGKAAGRQLVKTGPLIRRTRDQLLDRFSGRARKADDVIVVREPPSGHQGAKAKANRDALESGIL